MPPPADLYTAYMNSDNGSEIKLLKDIELDSTLVLDRGTSVTIDLAGNDIPAAEGNVIRIESGTITIRDSESSCSIDESDWTVDYSGGKIVTTAGNTSHAVTVSGNRAHLIMESGMVESVANCGKIFYSEAVFAVFCAAFGSAFNASEKYLLACALFQF